MFDNQNLQLLTLEVAESQHEIVFLRKICKGVANSSYGLHVAKMAGIPLQVIREAASFQKKHFDDYSLAGNVLQLDLFRQDLQNTQASHEAEPNRKPDLDSSVKDIIDRLRNYALEDSTPMQAMRFLEELKEDL
jgi:DNA mismatch repair protein MutS